MCEKDQKNTGLIFDIRRFSTHDGDGLRTNIFLKDCPLRCVWCQNPEGLASKAGIVWFSGRCIGCGTCGSMAKNGGILSEENGLVIDESCSEEWEQILEECPTGALRRDARYETVEEVLREIEKDRVFFRHGGGVTLSGGEPLMQPGFVIALLKELQEAGIHTAIETSLCASTDTVMQVAEHLDQIFCDLKLYDDAAHMDYTGVSNALIKENIRNLLTSPHREKVTVRTPLIPGMTATRENLQRIAGFLTELDPNVKYELLNYNPLASAKYENLPGRKYCFTEEENPRPYTREEMAAFGDLVKQLGIRNLIMEIE